MNGRYRCGLCMISPSADAFTGDRETVVEHLRDHGVTDIETYLTPNTEQATL